MHSIEVDFDVFKALTARRETEHTTYNHVIRELLGLPPAGRSTHKNADLVSPADWLTKGVRFPVGTDFRARYKGTSFGAKVIAGSLVVDGQTFGSPSAAAMHITQSPVNGWKFWECRLPGASSWQAIEDFRRNRRQTMTQPMTIMKVDEIALMIADNKNAIDRGLPAPHDVSPQDMKRAIAYLSSIKS